MSYVSDYGSYKDSICSVNSLNQATENKRTNAYWNLKHHSLVGQALSSKDECGNPFFKKHVTI